MYRLFAALVAVFFMYGCGQSVTLPKDKAEFGYEEIEKIAREYKPLADEAFADESVVMQARRAELRARLYAILDTLMLDVKLSRAETLIATLARVIPMLLGGAR